MDLNAFYQKLYDTGCVKFGEFTLKSGIKSPVYVDFRVTISNPSLLKEIGKVLADKAREIGCDRLCAIPYAGLPLGVATSIEGNIPLVYSRKEIKTYGTGKLIEGKFEETDKILVIDDIVTDGASKIEAIRPLKAEGLNVTDILVIIDREQGGTKLLAEAGYKLHSIGTLSQILEYLKSVNKIEDDLYNKVKDFIAQNQFKTIKVGN
ncbi:MAG: orotate phosphoribosyltransferase [Abditibacteriota bacterium]|nr:orotate phosphoribosyltransferase [Abditibacteriota bacterium]